MTERRRSLPLFHTLVVVGAVVIAGLLCVVLWAVANLSGRADQAEARADQAEADRAALVKQVQSLGEQPVVTPTPQPTPDQETVSAPEVRAIVAAELLERDLQLSPSQVDQIAATAARMIPRPKNGVNGKPPTAAEVRTVVEQVVSGVCANDGCKGDKGDAGDEGQPGEDGQDAPPVSDEQLDARLAAYCAAHNDCMGRDGKDGENGTPGRGIASGPDFVRDDTGECVARTTYDDGTTHDSPAGDAACPPTPLLGG